MNANRQSPDLLNNVRSLSRKVHDLIFPPTCLGCESMGAWLCPRCAQRVEPVGMNASAVAVAVPRPPH